MDKYIDTEVINSRGKLLITNDITGYSNILVDFYNIYCNFIKFNKYNTFTTKSFYKCIEIILTTITTGSLYIIAKEVYESNGIEKIVELTKKHVNLTYMIVQDYPKNTGNKERDDFYIIYLYYLLKLKMKKDAYIVTNDKFKNYLSIIKSIKPIQITIVYQGTVQYETFDMKRLNNIRTILLNQESQNINKSEYTFEK
jgi:hypothetical protein